MISGLEYLKQQRGLSDADIEAFSLGYCDDLGKVFVAKAWPTYDSLLDVQSRLKDSRFRNTALFPIFNLYGDIVGVSGRKVVQGENDPKYVNTVYPKTQHLFGFNLTYLDCLNAKSAFVVEGNLDTVTMYKFGIKNVVGMLSSNISFPQFCLLSRFVDEVIFVPDGDAAGQRFLDRVQGKGYSKILSICKKLELKTSYISLPSGYDPDAFLKKFGKDEFMKLNKGEFTTHG